MGRNVSISDEVAIITADYDVRAARFDSRERPVRIADHVFIGYRATILPGCAMDEGAVLAAGGVLTRSVPAFEIWGGYPARKICEWPRDLAYGTRYQRPSN